MEWSPLVCDGLRRRPGDVGDTASKSSPIERLRPPPPMTGEMVEVRGPPDTDDSREIDPRGFPPPPMYLGFGRGVGGQRAVGTVEIARQCVQQPVFKPCWSPSSTPTRNICAQ